MKTKFIKINDANKDAVLLEASKIIKSGGLVVFPTETVYGLGANALDEKAVTNIFTAKGRPSDNPIIIHIYSRDQLFELTKNISLVQEKLMEAFWPGPLTIIFDKKESVSDTVSGGLPTVAVRMPADTIARELIRLSDVPIAAPSANTSGRPSSTKGEHAHEDLIDKVDIVIDSGSSSIGVESTVVKANEDQIIILRPGAITKEMLFEVSGVPVVFSKNQKDLSASPGTRYRHYAPKAPLELLNTNEMPLHARDLSRQGKKLGIMCSTEEKDKYLEEYKNVFVLGSKNNLEEISKNIYAGLRYFDALDVDVILCESFPKEGIGEAIMNRLEKASKGK